MASAPTRSSNLCPSPTGPAPYWLDLATIIGADAVAAIRTAGQLRWHMVGDVGGVKSPQPQRIVADTMVRDFGTDPTPSLLYLVGDVIYFNGERGQYYPQLYEPYSSYPASVVAIPGNHDGDPLSGGEPLGVNEGTLGNWVSQYRKDHASEEPPLTPPRRTNGSSSPRLEVNSSNCAWRTNF